MNITITQKPFNIPRRRLNKFSVDAIEDMLYTFNLSCSGEFYIADYYHERIIIPSPFASILCGYSRDEAVHSGFNFYEKILPPDEWDWINQMNEAAHKLFFQLSKSKRRGFIVAYDLEVLTAGGEKVILHHKVIPYKLCNNGNVWLALCHVMVSTKKKMPYKATVINIATGERFDLVNGEFVLSDTPIISSEEIQILKWMIQGLPIKKMYSLSGVSETTFKAKKNALFEKLEAQSASEAIHQAHLLGIF